MLMPALNLALSLPTLSSVGLLRQHTRSAHDAIESVPCMTRLLAPDYTITEYRTLLLRLLSYLEPLELQLNSVPTSAFQLGCSRSACLRADLRAIGVNAVTNTQCASFSGFNFADESVRAGICYVFEGSALGGQVIRRALQRNLGAPVAHAVNYFDCYQGNHGKVWRKTLEQIEQTPNLDSSRMVNAAAGMFFLLGAWLNAEEGSAPPLSQHHSGQFSASKQSRCPFARFSNWVGL